MFAFLRPLRDGAAFALALLLGATAALPPCGGTSVWTDLQPPGRRSCCGAPNAACCKTPCCLTQTPAPGSRPLGAPNKQVVEDTFWSALFAAAGTGAREGSTASRDDAFLVGGAASDLPTLQARHVRLQI